MARCECGTVATAHRKKGADRSRGPSAHCKANDTLIRLFLCARVGRSIPRAASLRAIGLGLCGGYISREGWTCEGKCECHCKNRNKSFHDYLPYAGTKATAKELGSGDWVPGTPDLIAG